MSTTTMQEDRKTAAAWSDELSNPEVQQALAVLIQKLPQIKEAVLKMEQGVELVTHAVNNTQTIGYLAEPIDKISKIALNKENVEALGTIVDKLPRIAQTLELLDRVSPFIEALARKETLISVAEVMQLVAEPVTERVQDGMFIVSEARKRAEQNQATVSVFGLLKMLKDPAVQSGIKFVQALLEVLQERKVLK